MRAWWCTAALLCATACGNDIQIQSGTLSGTFGGGNWRFGGGRSTMGFEPGEVLLELRTEALAECTTVPPTSAKYVIIATKAEVTSFDFSTEQNATFVTETPGGTPENKATLTGKLRIDEVTMSTIKGGLAARYDSDNDVSGTFEVMRCDQ